MQRSKKIVIVGGVAGGASTAARLRRLNEDFEIIMFEKGEYISFSNCSLPYYIGESIKDRGNLLVQIVKGINECNNLFTLRNIHDTDKIKHYVDINKQKHALVIGGVLGNARNKIYKHLVTKY